MMRCAARLSLQSGTGASGGFVQSANSAVMDMMMDDSEMTEKANRTRKRWYVTGHRPDITGLLYNFSSHCCQLLILLIVRIHIQ